jgi:hypothetical protein
MFILYALPIGLLAGLALGGRLEGLGRLQFRWGWVFAIGLVVQLVLFSDYVGWVGMPIYVGSTLLVALVVVANYPIAGMPIAAAGAFSNLAAIVANGGYMPASESALTALTKIVKGTYTNSSFVEHPNLPWLTDIFAMPAWLPAANVFSIGDVLIGLGVVVVIAAAMRSSGVPHGSAGSGAPDSAGAPDGAQPGAA